MCVPRCGPVTFFTHHTVRNTFSPPPNIYAMINVCRQRKKKMNCTCYARRSEFIIVAWIQSNGQSFVVVVAVVAPRNTENSRVASSPLLWAIDDNIHRFGHTIGEFTLFLFLVSHPVAIVSILLQAYTYDVPFVTGIMASTTSRNGKPFKKRSE